MPWEENREQSELRENVESVPLQEQLVDGRKTCGSSEAARLGVKCSTLSQEHTNTVQCGGADSEGVREIFFEFF